MMDHKENQSMEIQQDRGEISLKELILRIKEVLAFLRRKWIIILLLIVIGAVLGFVWAKFKKPKYMAQSVFVLDESNNKSSQLGGLAALGLDLGNSSADGLFSGSKNIIWLYSSRPMIKRTLLTSVIHNGRKELLIDWFLETSKLSKNPGFAKGQFLGITDTAILNPVQNALINECYGTIVAKYLKIKEQDGTDNMIRVEVTSSDELFSKEFTETLVNTVNQFYIHSKTLKISEEINVLQRKADSIRYKMDNAMYQAASAIDAAPNANPNLQVLRVAPQRKGVDVNVSTALYIELAKNLESRKMALSQETPLIQVIENPSLPLQVILPSPITYAILWGFVFGFLTVAFLVVRFLYIKIMA